MTDRERIEVWLGQDCACSHEGACLHCGGGERIVRASLAIIDAEHTQASDDGRQMPYCGCVLSRDLAFNWPCMLAQRHEAKLWQAINGASE